MRGLIGMLCSLCACAQIVGIDDLEAAYRIQGDPAFGPLRGNTAGGGPDFDLDCGEDAVAGQEGRLSTEGDPYAMVFECARVNLDGSVALDSTTAKIGIGCGTDYTPEWIDTCPDGTVAVGLYGQVVDPATPIIGMLGLTCAPLDSWVADGSGAVQTPPRGADTTQIQVETFDDRCAPGAVLTRLTGRAGCLIDAIQPWCRVVAH